MMYCRANKVQRFFAYFIDIMIFTYIIGFIVSGICSAIGTGNAEQYLNSFFQEYDKLLAAMESNSTFDTAFMESQLWGYIKCMAIELALSSVFYLVFAVLYLVILPKYWKKQTLGRMIMKVKVVKQDGSDPNLKTLILREIIGTYVMYLLFGGVMMLVTFILIVSKGRSIVDYIGKTELISLVDENPEYQEPQAKEEYKNEDDEYIDARFKELKDEPANSSSDDDYTII